MDTHTPEDPDELVAGMKELLLSFGPHIRQAGSANHAVDTLINLEEFDENFHRYGFVQKLQSHIETRLGPLIDNEIEKHAISPTDSAGEQETAVNMIIEKVLGSSENETFLKGMKSQVEEASSYLINNLETEFADERSDKSTVGRSGHKRTEVIFSDGESSFGDSSLNQSTVMFMNNDQFQEIADKLDKKKPFETRVDALKTLLQITTTTDVQNYEAWSRIRSGLQDALADSDEQLWCRSLRFIAKSLSANNSGTKDIFTTLVEFLSVQFHSVSKGNIPKVKNGLDYTTPENTKLLTAFRLMNEFQLQVPQYWVRFPEKFVEDVMDSALTLLSIYHNPAVGTPMHMTPLHFLAVVDPQARWFQRWMHGHYSRAPLFKVLERHRAAIDNAVKSCVEYVSARKLPLDVSKCSDTSPRSTSSDGKRPTYTGAELDFAYFVHSLYFLGRLIRYECGRKFFPVKVKDRDEPVTVTKLLVTMVQLITESHAPTILQGPADYDPCRLVCDVIRKINSSSVMCEQFICRDEITGALLEPVARWVENPDATLTSGQEAMLLYVADILAQIASHACGRHHLLYGQDRDRFTRTKSSAAHILAKFVTRAVGGQSQLHLSQAVVGNIMFVCRQLYTTCEGLLMLMPYNLSNVIAAAWRVANSEADRAATPTPSQEDSNSANIVLWEDSLRDNLLNFAGTPKGVLLMQQTGAMSECVCYMSSRYERKLQVSKCEKFGYGHMMSQVAATAPGMVALHSTGFTETLVWALWNSLEVVDDNPCHSPKSWPLLPIDRSSRKPLTSLVNLLSSFPAVYEVLGGCKLASKDSYSVRDRPDSIAPARKLDYVIAAASDENLARFRENAHQGVLDRIVIIDSDAKILSLFNYEQSHVFGLRLLSAMTACLDTLLLLQTQYKFQDLLLKAQAENTAEDSSEIILDMLSVERNHVLVRTYMVGGASERTLPPREINMSRGAVFKYPLFTSYPVPAAYVPSVSSRSSMKHESDLSKYLSDTKKSTLNLSWLEKCRKSFCSVLTTKPEHAREKVLQDLLERAVQAVAHVPEDAIFPKIEFTATESNINSYKLTALQKLGVETAIRYGLHLKLISNGTDATQKLTHLVKKVHMFLSQQQRVVADTQLRTLKGAYVGFDWFAATVFLLMHGNSDRAWKFLSNFSMLAASAYLWTHRLHSSVHLPLSLMESGIPPLVSCSCHYVEFILQAEVSHVYSAFKMSGYTPAQICQQWVRQCFWNYLDWQEVCQYICMCLVLGVDYQVYMCVAALRYLQRDILLSMQDKNLILFLKEEPIRGFRVGEHLEYMQQLERRYRGTVLPDMQMVSKP